MAKKSKRGSGPRPGSDRAERVAARKARQAAAMAPPPRPFDGLAAECDLVALRSFVASATALLDLVEPGPADPVLTSVVPQEEEQPAAPVEPGTRNSVTVATILPGAIPALVRESSGAPQGLVGLQTDPEPADLAASVADAIRWSAHAQPGEEYAPGDGSASLLDLLTPESQLDIVVHEDFSWWFTSSEEVPHEIAHMLERANDTVMPTARLSPASGNGAPWWVDAGDRAHLRWVRSEPEDDLMTALARLHADGRLTLGEGSRFVGSFRTHGLLVPVFDLDNERHHEEWYPGLDEFDRYLTDALGDTSDLTSEQRRSRDGIRGRQITIR
ncbi:DUF5926 family protein [Gordonia soli]|uniref:DUF5926 domain-containing protein n=1 Tax=Gordonia soli NBRC 108243 TaxID=1223545 RepID=M0QL01_9ACTN|nr:DUF5926 family protein [Gordonia soli]GAC69320.1 hypothetical protein GS4_23_01170 [Gordonia soli NBRC 108243]